MPGSFITPNKLHAHIFKVLHANHHPAIVQSFLSGTWGWQTSVPFFLVLSISGTVSELFSKIQNNRSRKATFSAWKIHKFVSHFAAKNTVHTLKHMAVRKWRTVGTVLAVILYEKSSFYGVAKALVSERRTVWSVFYSLSIVEEVEWKLRF